MYTTYGIVHPEIRLFVYVGQSGDFEGRKRAHLTTHRQKKTNHKKGSLQAWLIDAHAKKITPVFVTLEVVETEALSLDSENNWVEKLATIGHPLLNRWEEHQDLIAAGRGAPAEESEAIIFYGSGRRRRVGDVKPNSRQSGYILNVREGVTIKGQARIEILPPIGRGK